MHSTISPPSRSDKANKETETMGFQLISGMFSTQDSMDILTRMVQLKIAFHEEKIQAGSSEEDIHMRERRIRELQQDLQQLRQFICRGTGRVDIRAVVDIAC